VKKARLIDWVLTHVDEIHEAIDNVAERWREAA
jgi:hypothetical protein